MHKLIAVVAGLMLGLGQLALVGFGFGGGALAAATCQPAGSSGMTAVIVATSGQTISGAIDATGCDNGIYVGPGVTGVTIHTSTITGANAHAIYVQDTSGVTIEHNTVTNNAPMGEIFEETKAIQVTGSSHVVIQHNVVNNNGGGGIAVIDDGDFNASGPNPGMALPGNDNVIAQNTVLDSDPNGGCGIVVAAYNPGEGVSGNQIVGNVVNNNPAGIVVAADAPNTTATDNRVVNNTANQNGFAGIIIHSNAPGDYVAGNMVVNNSVSGNFSGIGILVEAVAPTAVLTNTKVVNNRVSDQTDPIEYSSSTNTMVVANKIS